jgi:LysR family transcriptional regulator of gallate degradation
VSLSSLLKPLRAVQAVAVMGSTVEAAEAMHVSQSAVVRTIQGVEQALGFALFERHARGMTPTSAGNLVTRRVERALELLAQVDHPARRDRRIPHPRLAWLRSRLAAGIGQRHVRVLITLAEVQTQTAAASRLGQRQPSTHAALAELEHLAGQMLFHRGRHGLRLTEPGEALLRAAKLALAELAHAEDDVAALRGAVRGRVIVGTLPFSTGLFVPRALDLLLGTHPDLAVTVVDGTYATLIRQLRDAEIDLVVGALRDRTPGPDVQQEPLFDDKLAVVAAGDHALARRTNLRLRDLRDAAWVLPMPGTPAQAAFDEAFRAEWLAPPADRLRVNNATMMQALVVEGRRLALMSARHVEREVAAGLLAVLPIALRHGQRSIGITTRADYLPTRGAELLLQALREAAQSLNAAGADQGRP